MRERASVAILDRNVEATACAEAKLRDSAIALHANVSEGASVERAIAEILKHFDRIDAVHNNVEIANPSKPLHETSETEWDDLFRINIKSVYRTTKYAFEALVASKGAILNTASMVGLIGQRAHATWVATKGAVSKGPNVESHH